jgi:hypothetical protein
MARATYEELSELLLLERAEGQELRDANQRLNEIVIRLIKILADAVPRMEERHGRTVMGPQAYRRQGNEPESEVT